MKVVVKELVPEFVGEINAFPFDAIDDQVIRELRAAWAKYPVIRFRNVKIGDREQVTFTRLLGEPVIHPRQLQEGKNAEFPEILVISNKKKADGSAAGDLGDAEVNWHTDTTFVERPPSASILRAIQIPPEGGNTYWANMYSAYAALPEAMKAKLRGLTIHHQSLVDGRTDVAKFAWAEKSPCPMIPRTGRASTIRSFATMLTRVLPVFTWGALPGAYRSLGCRLRRLRNSSANSGGCPLCRSTCGARSGRKAT